MNDETWFNLLESFKIDDPERPWKLWVMEEQRFAYVDEPLPDDVGSPGCDYCSEAGADRLYIPAGMKASRFFVHRSCLDAHMKEDYRLFIRQRENDRMNSILKNMNLAIKNYPDMKEQIERQVGNFYFGRKK